MRRQPAIGRLQPVTHPLSTWGIIETMVPLGYSSIWYSNWVKSSETRPPCIFVTKNDNGGVVLWRISIIACSLSMTSPLTKSY